MIEKKGEKSPGAAKNLFAALRPFFKWCAHRDIIAQSPMLSLPTPKASKARDRILSDEEIKAFLKATEAMGWPFEPFYKTLLLTAQRRDEVCEMRWSELDLQTQTWTIPKDRTKNGKEHIVHLSSQAVELFQGLPTKPDSQEDKSKLVFTNNGVAPIGDHSKKKDKLDDLMQAILRPNELPHFIVHDLRRTAASGMARLKIPPHIIERVLNHVSGVNSGLVSVYQRYDYLEDRRMALEAWGQYVETLVAKDSNEKRTTDEKEDRTVEA